MSKKLLLLILLPFTLLACKGNPVLGTWIASSAMGSTTMTFKADNTFEAKAGTVTFLSGKYEVKGTEVDLTPSQAGGVSMNGVTGGPAQATLSADGKSLSLGPVTYTKQ